MIDARVVDAVEGLQDFVEADGGAFELVGFDTPSGVLRLRLVLDRVTCEECILPSDLLEDMVTEFVRRTVTQVARVELEDPRSVS